MPVDQTTQLSISCDNPTCPGNDLDPTDRTGWLFITSEVYGQPTQQSVYCSADCAGTTASSYAEILIGPEPEPELADPDASEPEATSRKRSGSKR